MKLVVAQVERGVDRLEGLEVDVHLALLRSCEFRGGFRGGECIISGQSAGGGPIASLFIYDMFIYNI